MVDIDKLKRYLKTPRTYKEMEKFAGGASQLHNLKNSLNGSMRIRVLKAASIWYMPGWIDLHSDPSAPKLLQNIRMNVSWRAQETPNITDEELVKFLRMMQTGLAGTIKILEDRIYAEDDSSGEDLEDA